MIEIRNVNASYGGDEILHDVSLTLPDGTLSCIIGPNGSGKSTLLKCISRIEGVYTGDIVVDGIPAATLSGKELAQHVSYLAQSRNTPDITAGRMVLHGRFPYLSYPRSYSKKDRDIADRAMQRMDALPYKDHLVSTLSGGQRQKVYLAMALAQETANVLMDEPTTYLDVRLQLALMKVMTMLKEEGKAVVMVLHDLPLALKYSQKIIVLDEGRIRMTGSPEEVFESGILDKVFGIHVKRMKPEGEWQYYYE